MNITIHITSDINSNFKKVTFELANEENNTQNIKFQKHTHDCITTTIIQYTHYLNTALDLRIRCNKCLGDPQQENLLT